MKIYSSVQSENSYICGRSRVNMKVTDENEDVPKLGKLHLHFSYNVFCSIHDFYADAYTTNIDRFADEKKKDCLCGTYNVGWSIWRESKTNVMRILCKCHS